MADWAVANGYYKLPAHATERRCAEELSEAMRLDVMTIEGGHRVRTMHAWPGGKQRTLWDDIRTITRDNMMLSVAHKRNGIVGEVKQIKIDLDFFNELHADEPPVQMSFSFENDLADAGLLTVSSNGPNWPPPATPQRRASRPSRSRP
jgi:hypothetical protein